MRWHTVLGLMAATYLLSRFCGWAFAVYPIIDIPFHILGGFLAACLGLALWREVVKRENVKGVPPYAVALMLVSFAALVAVLWEFHEFAIDWFHAREGEVFFRSQPSTADTMKDLADGLIGACLVVLIYRKKLSKGRVS